MKNKLIIIAGAVAALVSFNTVQATPISGSIGFTGLYTQNGGTSGDLTTATSMNIDSTSILFANGSFSGAVLGNFASPIVVNPPGSIFTGPSEIGTLWSVIAGGLTYTFTVTSENETLDTQTQLNLAGNGTITDGVGDSSSGSWQLGFGVSGDAFTWQSTSTTTPDGGTTMMLLGSALVGLGFIKRKLSA